MNHNKSSITLIIGTMIVMACIVLWGGFAHAQTASVPNTFTAGTPISATEVNANFQALVDAINSLGPSGLPTAGIEGTYELTEFEVGGIAGETNYATVSVRGGKWDVTIDGSTFTMVRKSNNLVEQRVTAISTMVAVGGPTPGSPSTTALDSVNLQSTHSTDSSGGPSSISTPYTLSASGELTTFDPSDPDVPDSVIQMAPDFQMGVGFRFQTNATDGGGTFQSVNLLILVKKS